MNTLKFIYIDGYNVINAWSMLKVLKDESLEDSRDKLIDMIHEYAEFKNIDISVVFDAHLQKGSAEKHIKNGKIEVVYTKEGEIADCYIERNVQDRSKRGIVGVVTSDYLEQRITFQMGAIRITPKEFLNDIVKIKEHIDTRTRLKYEEEHNNLSKHVDKDTMKKLEKLRRGL